MQVILVSRVLQIGLAQLRGERRIYCRHDSSPGAGYGSLARLYLKNILLHNTAISRFEVCSGMGSRN